MKTAHVVENGLVVNCIVLNDDADPAVFGAVSGPADAGIGWTVDGDTWAPPAGLSVPINDLRAAAKAAVDAAAEAYRLTYITPGAGQAMAYTQKRAEAQAYLADTDLTAAECPHIYAEIGITGPTAEAVAQTVVAMHAAWQVKSAEIERKRLAAKAAIDAAETAEAISNATDIDWDA